MSILRLKSRENVICVWSRIIFSLIKEGYSAIGDKADDPWGYAKYNKLISERQVLHDSTYMRYLK
jgi:hypothetical protein